MGVIEIAIIVAAGIFLLWLWRGGGQSAPVAAAPACAKASCGPPRAMGCLGVLFALAVASVLLVMGVRIQRLSVVGLAIFSGIALLWYAGRWGRGLATLGMLALAGLTVMGLGLYSIRLAQQKAHFADIEKLHWVDDWLDGPAAEFSPFHRARIERARDQVEQKKAQAIEQIRRHALRGRSQDGLFPIPPQPSFEDWNSGAAQAGGAVLHIDLKPDVLSTGNVSPDALAATLLAMVDLLATTDKPGELSSVSLSTLYHVDVQSRNGRTVPLSQIAHLRTESRKGGGARIALISLKLNDKNKRPEQEQIRQVARFLGGIEIDRNSQRGHAGFQSSHSDSNLFISIEPTPAVGIPVEAELAAAIPEAAPTPVTPSIAPVAPAPSAVPAPAPAPAAPKRKLKSPIEGTVPDLLMAYQLMMWTLPESLGGVAEYIPVAQPSVAVVTTPPAATEVAQAKPVESVAVVVEAPPAAPAPAAAPQPAPTLAAPAAESTPAARPRWLEGKAEYLDSHGDYFMRRSTGRLYQTADESHEAAAELLVEMTRDYVTSLLGKEAAAQVSIPIHTVLHDFVEATFDEQGPPPGLPDDDAWETHVLLKFDNTDRQLVEQAWRHSVVDRNLRYAGAGAGLLLALLGTVFGYLKVDTATRGYYSGRLKLATGAILAAITTLGILLVAGTLRL